MSSTKMMAILSRLQCVRYTPPICVWVYISECCICMRMFTSISVWCVLHVLYMRQLPIKMAVCIICSYFYQFNYTIVPLYVKWCGRKIYVDHGDDQLNVAEHIENAVLRWIWTIFHICAFAISSRLCAVHALSSILQYFVLTHSGRVTHICVSKLTIIDSDNGLSPGRRQAIIWTNARILLIGPLGTNFSDILNGIQTFSFKKVHLKMSSAKWRSFPLGLNVLMFSFDIFILSWRLHGLALYYAGMPILL